MAADMFPSSCSTAISRSSPFVSLHARFRSLNCSDPSPPFFPVRTAVESREFGCASAEELLYVSLFSSASLAPSLTTPRTVSTADMGKPASLAECASINYPTTGSESRRSSSSTRSKSSIAWFWLARELSGREGTTSRSRMTRRRGRGRGVEGI